MKFLFIMNGIGSESNLPGISGGDMRWVELAKIWQKIGHEIHVFTPKVGEDFCKRLGLDATFHLFDVPNKYGLKTYFLRAFKSFILPSSLKQFDGIVYSTTEHWYDVIPAMKIKRRNKSDRWGAVAHWVAPLKRIGTSFLHGFLFYINQRVGFYYIKKYADVVLAVSEHTANQLINIGLPQKRIFSVGCGVNYQKIQELVKKGSKKEYDAIFMKRFDGTKGIFDIIEIWNKVVQNKKDAKLGMIGLGTKDVMSKLKKMINGYNIGENIDFLGPIYDYNKKFLTLAKSRLFVLPSYEENWAIVIGEAMACGIPVICYDLPEIKPIWKDNVVWTPMGDKEAFADAIIQLLDDNKKREKMSEKEMKFIKRYDWKNIAEDELEYIVNG